MFFVAFGCLFFGQVLLAFSESAFKRARGEKIDSKRLSTLWNFLRLDRCKRVQFVVLGKCGILNSCLQKSASIVLRTSAPKCSKGLLHNTLPEFFFHRPTFSQHTFCCTSLLLGCVDALAFFCALLVWRTTITQFFNGTVATLAGH